MRCLARQKRPVLVSRYLGKHQVTDDEGRLTGRYEVEYSHQVPVMASVSSAKGSVSEDVFGQSLDYDKTLLIDDPRFPIEESSVLWVDCIEPSLLEAWFDKGPFELTGEDVDGGTFDDYASGDSLDEGEFDEKGFPVFAGVPFDYKVVRVSRTESYTAVAVKRIEVSR